MKITLTLDISPPDITINNVIASNDSGDGWLEVRTATKVYRFLKEKIVYTLEEP